MPGIKKQVFQSRDDCLIWSDWYTFPFFSGQIKYKAHVQKTRNDYKLVTDTPLYVQAVKSGKQLSDVSEFGVVTVEMNKEQAPLG